MKSTVELKLIVCFKYKSLKFKNLSKEVILQIDESVFKAGGIELQEVIENQVWKHLVAQEAVAKINRRNYSESRITFKATVNHVSEEAVVLLSNYYSEDELRLLGEVDVEKALEVELSKNVKNMVEYRVYVGEQELTFN
ncbi:hypothetical protein ABC382_01090 [Lysinibacillus sp. 1P01SD]|uniref:hypothetical protein n=1 Tax=Lysinibacillus sp. 1P01SD TaxID=3132285 RepID=UPI0039A0B240